MDYQTTAYIYTRFKSEMMKKSGVDIGRILPEAESEKRTNQDADHKG